MNHSEKTMEKIVNLCKSRGFVYPGSEIYGGLSNSWDYGPLGVEFKNNVKRAWWKKFVQESPYNVGLDSAILMNPQVWVASGHVGGFSDPLMDCKDCKTRHRADKLIEDATGEIADGWSNEQMYDYIKEHGITCPECGSANFTEIRKFNLMFKTFQGVTEDAKSEIYLRPETAQGIFVNFMNIQRTTRKKVPFGVAQVGKSFRNEITPGNFIFRIREFEQMELEFFCKPDTDLEWFQYWRSFCENWLLALGMAKDNMRLRDHAKEELSFYSKATTDIEYLFPFGWGELWGIADRTKYDLSRHAECSGQARLFRSRDERAVRPLCGRAVARRGPRRARLPLRRLRRGGRRHRREGQGGRACRHAPAPDARPLQGVRAAPLQKARRGRRKDLRVALEGIHGRLRRRGFDRQAVPPPGRDRHARLHHLRFRQ